MNIWKKKIGKNPKATFVRVRNESNWGELLESMAITNPIEKTTKIFATNTSETFGVCLDVDLLDLLIRYTVGEWHTAKEINEKYNFSTYRTIYHTNTSKEYDFVILYGTFETQSPKRFVEKILTNEGIAEYYISKIYTETDRGEIIMTIDYEPIEEGKPVVSVSATMCTYMFDFYMTPVPCGKDYSDEDKVTEEGK